MKAQCTLLNVDLWDDIGMPEIDLKIDFEFQPASHSDHPYGEGFVREFHRAGVHITSIRLIEGTTLRDIHEQPIRSLCAGTDLMSASSTSQIEHLEDVILGSIERSGNDRSGNFLL